MQQTEKYKLNLIESSDPFLPEGLNQNTQKIEDVMKAHTAENRAMLDDFDKRLGFGGKTARIAYGSYVGDGQCGQDRPTTLTLDFYPLAVFMRAEYLYCTPVFRGQEIWADSDSSRSSGSVFWTDSQVKFIGTTTQNQFNNQGQQYYYVVIGCDLDS